MTTLCIECNDVQKELGCRANCKSCSSSFRLDLHKREFTLAIDPKNLTYSRPFMDNFAVSQNSTITELVPENRTPTCSCPGSLNSASDCGNSISEMISHTRLNGLESVDVHLEQPSRITKREEVFKTRLNGLESVHVHLEQSSRVTKREEVAGSRIFSETDSSQTSYYTTLLDRTEDAILLSETPRSRTDALESYQSSMDERLPRVDRSLEDNRTVGLKAGEDLSNYENANSRSTSPVLFLLKTDPIIWMPPEPTNFEDDMDSVANIDDDDDDDNYNDGTKWGHSTSFGDFDKVHGNNYKEARQKAMVAAMNGQFKILVSRFLASEGLNSTDEGHGPGWLDIVTSLSWEAALYIKPDAREGRAMDPGSYVKIKCVASGDRNQSQVIKGLIFKKNAAHKHMPTKCKNPRLLLVKGVLGQRELGLSSFNSMDQERDYLNSINEMIEACHPNLVLVEKSVSRDMQELLLAKGMTLVFDMKMSRLERIARCVGSQIINSADILTNRNIKQCDSFHFEKIVEEHNSSAEVGKKATKTLMFLEGFSKPLGCTILLKGAHIDELKRVKRVIQYTIFAAYHLILETSFFADQRALFSNIDSSEGVSELTNERLHQIESDAAPDFSSDLTISNELLENSAHEGFLTPHLSASISSDDPGFVCDIDFCEDNFSQDLTRGITNENALNHSCALSSSDLPRVLISSFSASLRKLLSDNGLTAIASDSISSFYGFKEEEHEYPIFIDLPISSSVGTLDVGLEAYGNIMEEKLKDDSFENGSSEALSTSYEHVHGHTSTTGSSNKNETEYEEHDYLSLSDLPISSVLTIDDGIEANGNMMEEKPKHDSIDNGSSEALSSSNEDVHSLTTVTTNKIENGCKDDRDGVLSPESILVLLSSQCIEKGLVCEQSHLSRIKYYGNFDVSLGRYLQDVLLNQKHVCSSCGEPPEAHVYCYTHQNGNLTVLVKRLPSNSSLSGETEEKIWMWSRCLKCEHENGIPRSTKRIVMSTAARSLSFGKFLELSFTSHSAASRLSSECGHSLHRDCLRFFGLGSKVAMFRYSPVEIYAACKPPPMLEFANPTGQDWLVLEAKSLLQRGENFFSEVANFLHKLKMSCLGTISEQYNNCSVFVKSICEAENMLMQEKSDFETPLFKALNHTERPEKCVNEIPGLSWFSQELLLALYIWDRRLHQLSQISKDFDKSLDESERCMEKSSIEIGDVTSGLQNHITINVQQSISGGSNNDQNHVYPDSYATSNSTEISQSSGSNYNMKCSTEPVCIYQSATENSPATAEQNAISRSPDNSSSTETEETFTSVVVPVHDVLSMECSGRSNVSDLEKMIDNRLNGSRLVLDSILKRQHSSTGTFRNSPTLNFEDPESLVWVPFSELRNACKKDLSGGYLHKFLFIRTYTPKYLSPMHQLFPQERGLLHYTVGCSGNVMSVCEDEISSIIACALSLSEDLNCSMETVDVKDVFGGKMDADKEIDDPSNLAFEGSVVSSFWSSNGSFDSIGVHTSRSFSSHSSDELSHSFLESLQSMDRLINSESLHPEISLGVAKEGLRKYSVVCIHAKQFFALRRLCCPSEQAYILSLSRCRKWDAQGGKSKAFFAKTMDDRFIIKQIKKAELDSFLKFAPDYFKHITHSLSTGSQTCLAKILGIYQVRLTKSGKEVKIDLMVMENLLFGRNLTRTYDLKGAVFSRYITDVKDPEKVLLDQNFVEDMRLSPFYVGGRTKHLFQRAIWNDTSFLNAINVMDYSLLVGVDKKQKHLVFGIIDYLRQYTWDKQLETWAKSSLVVPKNSLPTIISPKEYKKRFRKFMSRYFLTVPDSWCSAECSEPCKFCTGWSRTSSSSHFSEPPRGEC